MLKNSRSRSRHHYFQARLKEARAKREAKLEKHAKQVPPPNHLFKTGFVQLPLSDPSHTESKGESLNQFVAETLEQEVHA